MNRETVGLVRNGRIVLPPGVELPEGATVHVTWQETSVTRIEDDPAGDPALSGPAATLQTMEEPLA